MDRLLSKASDSSLLISSFQEFLQMEDVRYYVMSSIRENVASVMERSRGVGEHIRFNLVTLHLQVASPEMSLVLLLAGCDAHVSEQRVQPHVQH